MNLYDIINDPFENNNLAEREPEKIRKMEEILTEMQQNTKKQNNMSNDDDDDEIKNELRKLGYL